MVKGEIFNTKVGYDLDSRSWTKIGKKEQWKYLGREQGKSKWVRDSRFPDAEKAEGTKNHFCCEALCYPLVVHQGPVNQWFFRRHSKNSALGPRRSTIEPCKTQKMINNLPLMDQSELIGAAKTFLCQFLNNEGGGKEEFEVESAKIDYEITNSGVVPSITIVHTGESRSETYVEIRVRDEIHHDSRTWGFYEKENPLTGKPWMDQLVPLHFKGKESGVRYDVASLPTQIVGQFRRRFIDRTNISKQWEDSRDLINKKEVEIQHAAEEEERLIIREKEAFERDLKLRMDRLEALEKRKKKAEKAEKIFHNFIRSLDSRRKRN